jgi:hypothetical protein
MDTLRFHIVLRQGNHAGIYAEIGVKSCDLNYASSRCLRYCIDSTIPNR